MNPSHDIERLIAGYRVRTDAAFDRRVLADASAALARCAVGDSMAQPRHSWIRRTIMRNQWTKSAAAASILVVAGAALWLFGRSASPSYALEQTLEASRAIRTVHARNVSPPAAEPQDMWLEYDDNGEVHRLRVEEGTEKTFRIMVWSKGELRWFSPVKNEFLVLHEPEATRELLNAREAWDPRFAMESIRRREQQKEVEIRVQEPKKAGEPITLEATELKLAPGLPPEAKPVRYVFLIDPETSLVTERDRYEWAEGSYRLEERRRYLEYDTPIDAKQFVLEPPQNVEPEDRTVGIGLPQGNLPDAEAAAAVVRKYLEALIAKDYATAGRLYNGRPAEELKQRVEEQLKIRYLRVVSIGQPEPVPASGPRVFQVPFAFEFEKDGAKQIAGPPVESGPGPRTHRKAAVRPVVGQPDRWVITGGI
jgi:hypothetical protein